MPDSEITPGPGVLLIAPPVLSDPNFRRTVVLLCEHGDAGSFGLILNRLLTLQLGDVLDSLSGRLEPLWLGGPVQPSTLHFLHRHGGEVEGAVPVFEDVCWGGHFDDVQGLLRRSATAASRLRFFLGYAGWIPGQLEAEIEGGGWILAPAETGFVFPEDADKLWSMVLRSLGGEYALIANFPEDPRLN